VVRGPFELVLTPIHLELGTPRRPTRELEDPNPETPGRRRPRRGRNRTISFRILHVCEFRGGKINRENVWLGGAAIMAQLTGD
jgi:hypothetical protein